MSVPDGSSLSEEQQTMESVSRSLAGGRYRLMRILGAGAMGSVRLAEDTALHRRVAIKTVKEEVARNSEIRKRIERECLLHAKVGPHPNIVTLFDKLEFDDEMHLVMEYIDGETLQARLERNADQGIVMPPAESILIATQVLDALSRIHAQGIVHRDIKPSNIMLTYTESGLVCSKLMDFGVSRFAEQDEQLSRLTTTDTGGPGTPLYMAPEQIDSKTFGEISYATDVYAVGVLLYQLLSGKPPYRGTLTEVLNGHLNMPLPPISVKLDGVLPDTIEGLLKRALAKKTVDRIQTAKAFREDLVTLTGVGDTMSRLGATVNLGSANSVPQPPSTVKPGLAALATQTFFGGNTVQRLARYRRSMRVLGVGVVFVLFVLIGSAFYFLRGSGTVTPTDVASDTQTPAQPLGVGISDQPITQPPAPPVATPPVNAEAVPNATVTTTTVTPLTTPAVGTTPTDPNQANASILPGVPGATPIGPSATTPPVGTNQVGATAMAYNQPTTGTADPNVVVVNATVLDPNAPVTTDGAREHVVQPGDTLRKIASAHGVYVSDIQWWNNIINPSSLKVGQTLALYAKPELESKEKFLSKVAAAEKQRKDAAAKKAQEDAAKAAPPAPAPQESAPTLESTFKGTPAPAPAPPKQPDKPRRGLFRGFRSNN